MSTHRNLLVVEMRSPGFTAASSISAMLSVAFLCAVLTVDGQIEDAAARAALPEFRVIPAAASAEMTPASGVPAASSLRNWTVSHGDAGSRRYSALDQINRSNVKELREVWRYHAHDGNSNIQANPIVVDGVMFAPTPGRAIVAVDATSGQERWRFQVEQPKRLGLEDTPARRGLVYWPGDTANPSRIIFTSGNWVYALDPAQGHLIKGFGENGRASLPTGGTAVGVIWQQSYIVPGLWGDIYSYDLRTGVLQWRFHTIAQPGEFGGETWGGAVRDGAHPWGGLALDESRSIVFAAIGAARPDFIGVDRPGDNLFSNCVLALDAKTGRRLWHFQNVRHDIWDLDNPAPPNLVTIKREGRDIDAVACVTKAGVTLLLDRVSGKSIFPFRLRRAPTSKLPGEITAAYQPDPELPEPISRPEFRWDEITNRTPSAHAFVLRQVQSATYGWFAPAEEGKPMLYHSSRGAAEWTGACVDVPTGRLYISSNNLISMATVFRSDELERDAAYPPSEGEKIFQQTCVGCHGTNRQGVGMVPSLVGLRHRLDDQTVSDLVKKGRGAMPPAPPMTANEHHALLDFLMRRDQPPSAASSRTGERGFFAVGYKFVNDDGGYPGGQPPWGLLNCIDLNTGKILWRVPLGEYDELTKRGLAATGTENFGGPTVTAGGLVFCAGTKDNKIRAFDKDTGAELWSATLPWAGAAPPSVYEVAGREYLVIAATGGGKLNVPAGDAYVAFALPLASQK